MRASAALRAWIRRWWTGDGGALGLLLDLLLAPAELAFRVAVRARDAGYEAGLLRARPASLPLVSVGNLTVGGTGKTPVAAWIAARLREWGAAPAVVLRGYGDDERLVHRELNPEIPVFTARNRAGGVAAALRAKCDCAVLDDGFQHRSLARDLDLVLVDADHWQRPRRRLPRGPWREDLRALRRADFVLVTRKVASRESATGIAAELAAALPGLEVGVCLLAPCALKPLHPRPAAPEELSWLRGRDVLAVTSLAGPEAFHRQLEALGAIVESADYPDHHLFDAVDAQALARRASGRPLVMTRKEAVKLRSLLDGSLTALVVEQEIRMETNRDGLERALRRALLREAE